MHYSIYAVDRNGDKIVVGEGFKGDSQAEAAIRLIGDVLNLRASKRTPIRPQFDDLRELNALAND
jgi:hypothetical protein